MRNAASIMPMVWPSGVARATICVPMVLLPPPRLSITTCWPNSSLMYGPTMRDSVSVSPPGTYGTTRRMGRVMGVFCVCACAREQTKNTAATNGKIDLVAGFIGWPV